MDTYIHSYSAINPTSDPNPIPTKPIPFNPIPQIPEPQDPPFHYIQSQLLSMESINTTYSSYIKPGMGEIEIDIYKPWVHRVIAMGDTGANINAISEGCAHHLYKKYIQTDSRAFRVRTGGGYISCQQYIPLSIKQDGVLLYHNKFYIIPDLPFDYLIGRPLLTRLGYDLTKIRPASQPTEYRHHPQTLDSVEDEDIVDNPYPVKPQSKTGQPSKTPQPVIANRCPALTKYIRNTLRDHTDICAQGEFDIGQIPDSEFKIEFRRNADTTPIRCAEYPHNVADIDEIERQLRLMVVMGLISPSDSPWRFPTFIVPKKNGEARIVFDYRKLNAITKRLAYSLPSIPNLLRKFRGKKWISTIDIKSGYWHIPIKKEDRPKTAFIFNGKVYEWNVMPFGPTNAPPHFQKTMDKIFSDLDYVMVYMDDITILSETPQQHQQHLHEVFSRLAKYKIKIRPDKCLFAQESVPYLGFEVDSNGVRIKSKYKDKILNIPTPQTLNQLRRFVGMVQYLHTFIPNLQQLLKPLHGLTEKNRRFEWSDELDTVFARIKNTVMDAEMLHHPDHNQPFAVYCDASIDGIGAVLVQHHGGRQVPVSFCSKLFSKTQRNWHVSEQEIYAVIHAVEKWRQYLITNHFTVYTDHLNLQELFNRAKNFRAGKLYRWAVRLQEYDFTAKYISGHKNTMADYMSRDALKPYHTDKQETNKSRTPTPILQLYLSHLSTTNKQPYTASSNHIIYTLNGSNTNSDVYNTSPSPPLPFASLYTTIANPSTNTTSSSNTPSASTSNNNSNNGIHLSLPDLHNIPTQPSKSKSSNISTPPIPNPIFSSPPPSHRYPTRLATRRKADIQFQSNLQRDLIHIPDPEASVPFDKEVHQPTSSPIMNTNKSIVFNKYSYPSHNQSLLQPTTPSSPKIQDEYDINSFVSSIPTSFLRYHQQNDAYLYPILQFLEHNNSYYLEDLEQYQLNYLLYGRYYINHQNILMYKYGGTNAIVLPSILKRSVLKWAHGRVHHGGAKMLLRITQQARYWWIGLRKDIKAYLECCDGCQRIQKGRSNVYTSGNIKTTSKTRPFQLVSIDICGPLPQTSNDNRYIVSMIDKFSRFCMLVPVRDIRTLTVVQAFQKWLDLFGAPEHLLSDNGSQFTSDIFRCFTQQTNTQQHFSTPYYPEGNGQIERLHRWLKERLSLISIDGGLNFIDGDDDWDEYIGAIQHAYNSTPNTMTKYSPNKIIFGDDLQYNINTTTTQLHTQSGIEYSHYMDNVRTIIHNNANTNQSHYDRIRSKSYNRDKSLPHEYEVGDLVLINISRRLTGNKAKLTPTWHGPHEIIRVIFPNKTYEIREVGNDSHIQEINIKFIKAYKTTPYVMIMNYVMDTESASINTRNVSRYIQQRRLTLNWLKQWTPSSKKRQL